MLLIHSFFFILLKNKERIKQKRQQKKLPFQMERAVGFGFGFGEDREWFRKVSTNNSNFHINIVIQNLSF